MDTSMDEWYAWGWQRLHWMSTMSTSLSKWRHLPADINMETKRMHRLLVQAFAGGDA